MEEATGEPLPKLPPGDPADQIQSFELKLVDRLWESATPENAREMSPTAPGTSSMIATTTIPSSSGSSSAIRRWRG